MTYENEKIIFANLGFDWQLTEMEESKAELETRYESRLNQLQQLNESLDASEMFESQEAELDKLRNTQVATNPTKATPENWNAILAFASVNGTKSVTMWKLLSSTFLWVIQHLFWGGGGRKSNITQPFWSVAW